MTSFVRQPLPKSSTGIVVDKEIPVQQSYRRISPPVQYRYGLQVSILEVPVYLNTSTGNYLPNFAFLRLLLNEWEALQHGRNCRSHLALTGERS